MTKPLRTIIVDDEADAVNFIRAIIAEHCPELEVVGAAGSADDAEKLALELRPELIFLDVEMPRGSGFDLLSRFPDKRFDVIFITAFNHYALRAIKFSAVDYLLKPINIGEFIGAVGKVLQKRSAGTWRATSFAELIENVRSVLPVKLAIPTADGMEYLNTQEIIRIEADRSYCWFFLSGNRKILVSRNLGEYQELLGDLHFFRPHNSHLINLSFVKKFVRLDGGSIEMTDGSQVPLSRLRRELFLSEMTKISR